LNINRISKSPPSILPVNRILFFSVDQQKKFVVWIFHLIMVFIVLGWIWDVIRYFSHTLIYTPAFWVRQSVNLLILAHAILIHYRYYSAVLLSVSVLMISAIFYLSFFGDFFPTNYYVFLAIIPIAIVNIYYEQKLSRWFVAFSCVALSGGLLLFFGASQLWNAILISLIFVVISLVIYLQNPSIRLLQMINEIHESQFTQMLQLVYDGVAVIQENKIIDADDGFYALFQIPPASRADLYLMDILEPASHQVVFEALHQEKSIMVQVLGKRYDGSHLPMEMNIACQTINKVEYAILAIHDASRQLNAEYALERKNNELLMINRISQMVNSSLSLGEVLSTILEESQAIYQNKSSSIWLLDERKEKFVCVNAKGSLASTKIGRHVGKHQGVFSFVVESQKPLFVRNIQDHALREKILNSGHGFEVISVLILPIFFQDKMIGLIQFLDDRVNILPEEDVEVLQAIAANSAIAINNARQFELLAGDQQRWRTIQNISQRINACLQPKEIFRAITENMRDIIEFDYFIIAICDDSLDGYDVVHMVDRNQEIPGFHLEKGEGLVGHIIENASPAMINNYPETHAAVINARYIDEADKQTKSVMAVPLIRGTQVIGMLSAQSYQKGAYESADLQMLELVAAHAVIALDNAQHYQEALESARLRDTIYLIGQEINSRLNPDQVYETIFRAIEKIIPMDFMFISSVDHEQGLQHFRFFKDKEVDMFHAPFSVPLEKGVSGYVIKTGKSFRTGDFTHVKIEGYEFVHLGSEDHITHSMLFVPMVRGTQVTGILSVQAKLPDMFTAYHQTLLELIAPYAASALENAWLFTKLETLAITDELSGVYNRHHFNHALKQEFERSVRYRRPLAIIVVDIDNFKIINDRYGHICGDEVIRQYGKILKDNVRSTDILARFGGDEFAIIMPETNAQQALIVTRKIEELCNQRKFLLDQDEINVTISIGLAQLDHEKDMKPEDLIHNADNAMYQAKSQGKHQTVVYDA